MTTDSIRRRFLITLLLWLSLASGAAARASVEAPQPDPDLRHALVEAVNDTDSFSDRFDAEVWLMDMSRRLQRHVPDFRERIQLLKMVHAEASRADLPPELVLAVIDVESRFDRWAISSAGAQGLMQVMPFWLAEIGRAEDNLHHPRTNLRMGCTILRYYLDREGGDLTRALARYNGSLGTTRYARRVLQALRTRWYRQ